MMPKPTRVDLEGASALTFVNGLQCTGVFGFLFMYLAFFSLIFSTRRAQGCLGVIPAIVSPRSILLISYWDDEKSLQRFIGVRTHVKWMRYLGRHPSSMRLFNETYGPPLRANHIGKPWGYARVQAETASTRG